MPLYGLNPYHHNIVQQFSVNSGAQLTEIDYDPEHNPSRPVSPSHNTNALGDTTHQIHDEFGFDRGDESIKSANF